MAFVLADRVKETSTTQGTGTISLSETAPTGFQTFAQALSSGDTTYYVIEDGTDWEAGIGTFTLGAPDTLSRDTIFASSNGGSAVDWGAGTRNVFIALPGEAVSSLLDTGSNGILVQTTARTYARRSITVTGPGLSIANGDGVSGNPDITITPNSFEEIPSTNAGVLFKEVSAPTGWTQDATVTFNEALRLVGTDGTGDGTGGSADISGGTVAAGTASSLSTAQLSVHKHPQRVDTATLAIGSGGPGSSLNVTNVDRGLTGDAGSGSTHAHGNVTYNIKFRNLILCDKDA